MPKSKRLKNKAASGARHGKNQPNPHAVLPLGLTATEIAGVVPHFGSFTTSYQSLVQRSLLVQGGLLVATNPRTGYRCCWSHEEWDEGLREADATPLKEEAVDCTRFAVELQLDSQYLIFEWLWSSRDGDAERALQQERSEAAFVLLAAMFGVPVRRQLVVGIPAA